tara:strand:+ start:2311 stop:3885 length:1575 start_codon:yes stop_codon:yes gene_type:complete
MSEYLKLKSTNERQSINIETRIVEPQTISDNTSGGQATFLLPTSGLLDRGTRVVIPVKGADAAQMFALTAGGFGVVQSATLRDHLGNTICQTNDLGQYMAWYNLHRPCAFRERVQACKTGNGFCWEEAKRFRLKGSTFNGMKDANYFYDVNGDGKGKVTERFAFTNNDTFEIILSLQDLFPELFGSLMLPLGVLEGALTLQLIFAPQTERGVAKAATNGIPAAAGAITIDTANVKMVLDLLYFDDGTMARLRAESNKGIPMVYGDLVTIKNAMVGDSTLAAPAAGAGSEVEKSFEFDIGLSNLNIRYIVCSFTTSQLGTQTDPSPLSTMGKYHSLAPRKVNGGLSTQLVINNQPHYPEPVTFFPRHYTELQEIHGFPLYVPQPLYSFQGVVWDEYAVEQLKEGITTAPANLPAVGAYCLETETVNTAGGANSRIIEPNNTEGTINNSFQLTCAGATRYVGFNLRHTRQNVVGAGTRVGNAPVQLKLRYTFDGNSLAAKNNLNLVSFVCVERKMMIKNGRIFVTN